MAQQFTKFRPRITRGASTALARLSLALETAVQNRKPETRNSPFDCLIVLLHTRPLSSILVPSMASDAQLTPMMAQYRRIKSELPRDALLLFRLGDFYELFFEDAQVGAQLLNVALTKRGVIPMCGIPFHAANNYIARLLTAGRK